jgi:hypothetical protein
LIEKHHVFNHDSISFLFFLKLQKPVSKLYKLKKDEKRDFCFKSNPFFNLIRDRLLRLVNQEKDEEKHGIIRSAFLLLARTQTLSQNVFTEPGQGEAHDPV